MDDCILLTDIIIPISTAILGAAVSWWATSRQYKKKVMVSIDPEQRCFKVYNTGNTGLVIKEVGVCQGTSIWFSQFCDKAIPVASDPLIIKYDECDFWNKIESAISEKTPKDKFHCFVLSADDKKYKTIANLKFKDFWNSHEWYWGRNLNDVIKDDLPF